LHGNRVGALRNEFEYFARCIREGIRPEVITPRESRDVVAVMCAAEESARSGQVVSMGVC
jgi:UDP-N-acetylglucosamine 3-dehydrogenase